jgi:TonB-dependent SusC/RagA subfamily outer membrane receptor
MSSINNVNALVIVDGVKGSLNELNPNDIESISVLKDASAASIYGSNAAGGVVIVTTKKGEKGKVTVNYSGNYGMTQASGMPERMKTWDEAKYYDASCINAGSYARWGETKYAWMRGEQLDVIDEYGIRSGVRPSDFPGTNFVIHSGRPNAWLSYGDYDQVEIALKKTNPIQSHNVSLRGGGEKTSYYFSAGYYDRRGIIRYGPDSEEKYNFKLNLNNQLTDKISLNTTLNYINNNIYQNAIGAEKILNDTYRLWGWIAPTNPEGNYHAGNGIWGSTVDMEKNGGNNTRNNYMFDGSANFKIDDMLPGLDVNVIGSKRIGTNRQVVNVRTLTYIGPLGTPTKIVNSPNRMSRTSTFSNYSSLQAFASYDYTLNDLHNLKLLGGYSYEDFRSESTSSGISNLVTNDFYSLGWGDAKTANVNDYIITYATMGVFSRFNYNFKEKYLFEANVRYDGSSRLAPENRWNLFPSFSTGWVISNEDFFKDDSFISQLKLRA